MFKQHANCVINLGWPSDKINARLLEVKDGGQWTVDSTAFMDWNYALWWKTKLDIRH